MAYESRLTAHVPGSVGDQIQEVADDEEVEKTEAERIVVREGLKSLGYVEQPKTPAETVLYHTKRIGYVLGFVGLILIGYGIFGTMLFRWWGFGLTLVGLGMIMTADLLAEYVLDNGR